MKLKKQIFRETKTVFVCGKGTYFSLYAACLRAAKDDLQNEAPAWGTQEYLKHENKIRERAQLYFAREKKMEQKNGTSL